MDVSLLYVTTACSAFADSSSFVIPPSSVSPSVFAPSVFAFHKKKIHASLLGVTNYFVKNPSVSHVVVVVACHDENYNVWHVS